jgi:hypothetical protein
MIEKNHVASQEPDLSENATTKDPQINPRSTDRFGTTNQRSLAVAITFPWLLPHPPFSSLGMSDQLIVPAVREIK